MKTFARLIKKKKQELSVTDKQDYLNKIYFIEFAWPSLQIKFCTERFAELLGYESRSVLFREFMNLVSSQQIEMIKGVGLGLFNNISLSFLSNKGKNYSFDVTLANKQDDKIQLCFYDVSKYERFSLQAWDKDKSSFYKGSIYDYCDVAKIGVFKSYLDTHEVVACNDYMARIMEYNSAEELISKNKTMTVKERLDFFPDEFNFRKLVQKDKNIDDYVVRLKIPGRREKFLRFSARISENEKFIDGTCIDITDLYQAKRELAEAQRSMHGIAEGTLDIIYQFRTWADGRYEFQYINSQVSKIFEYTPEEILKDSRLYFNKIIEEDRHSVLDTINIYYRTFVSLPVIDFRVKKNDGSVVWCRGTSFPINCQDGSVLWNGMVVDVTSEKENEIQRLEMQKELAQANKMKALGTLAGGVAHDFNNIIHGIRLTSELSTAKLALNKDFDCNKSFNDILGFCRRGAGLVKQILTYCRKDEIKMVPLDLGDEVFRAVSSLKGTISSNINLKIEKANEKLPIHGDVTQLYQVVNNLISNSLYALRDIECGEILIQLDEDDLSSADKKRLRLVGKKFARLRISDNGMGIDEEVRGRVLEPFFTTKPVGEGTGLGLSVVQGVMNRYGGAVDINPLAMGRGTEFALYFPITELDFMNKKEDEKLSLIKGKEKILLVDDEDDLRELTHSLLEGAGYQVFSASSGDEAMNLFISQPEEFDLVITDQVMPKMTGTQLCEKIRSYKAEQKIIIMSGYLSRDNFQTIQSLDIQGVVEKPFTLHSLGGKIRSVLVG